MSVENIKPADLIEETRKKYMAKWAEIQKAIPGELARIEVMFLLADIARGYGLPAEEFMQTAKAYAVAEIICTLGGADAPDEAPAEA